MASCKSRRAEGGLKLSCSLVFALVHVVLETSVFWSLRVNFFAEVRRRCCMGCCTAFFFSPLWLPFTAHQQLPTLHTEISSSPKSGVSSWTNLPMTLQKC